MHEVSLVAELVSECERLSSGQAVRLVRVRHASSIQEPALRQAFQMLTIDTGLSGARLETVTFDIELTCACGFNGVLGHDDVIARSVVVCPACGNVTTQRRTAELELIAMEIADQSRDPSSVNAPA